MTSRLSSTTPGRRPSPRRTAAAWITAILFLMFAVAGCDGERDHLHQIRTGSGLAHPDTGQAGYCAGAENPDEPPHAHHLASDEFAASGTDTPKIRAALEQGTAAGVEDIRTPGESTYSTGPPAVAGGRDVLTRFCISRR